MAIINSKLLMKRINSSQLGAFFVRENMKQHRYLNIEQKIEIVENLSKDDEEFKKRFNIFLIEQLKYTINSNIVTVPIKIIGSKNVLSSNAIFENKVKSFKIINEVSRLTDELLDEKFEENGNEYILVYSNKEVFNDSDKIKMISLCYARKKINISSDSNNEQIKTAELDTVFIDIFPQEKFYRVHISNQGRTLEQQSNSISTKLDFVSEKLKNLFDVKSTNASYKNTLYKIYRILTKKAEEEYVAKVEPKREEIIEFVKEISSKIEYDDDGDNSIKLKHRVIKMFERALIQQDYTNFVGSTENREGFIDKFQYQDQSGGRVLASSQSKEVSIKKHDVYFDTKESIEIQEQLNSIWVTWFKRNVIEGKEQINKISMRYEAYDSYLVTHFMNTQPKREDCDYVLQKFSEFERKTIQ